LPTESIALWVDEYRTGSASDRVGLAINNISISWIAENASLQDGELNASQTRSLPLPGVYSSTHNANRPSRQIHNPIDGSDSLSCYRVYDFLCKAMWIVS
jgi:hypothetical protein